MELNNIKKFKRMNNDHYKNCCYSISCYFNGKRYKLCFNYIERKIKEEE